MHYINTKQIVVFVILSHPSIYPHEQRMLISLVACVCLSGHTHFMAKYIDVRNGCASFPTRISGYFWFYHRPFQKGVHFVVDDIVVTHLEESHEFSIYGCGVNNVMESTLHYNKQRTQCAHAHPMPKGEMYMQQLYGLSSDNFLTRSMTI